MPALRCSCYRGPSPRDLVCIGFTHAAPEESMIASVVGGRWTNLLPNLPDLLSHPPISARQHGLVRYGTGPVRRKEPSAIHDAILFADAPTPDATGSPSTNGNGMKACRCNLLLAPRPTSDSSPMLSTGVSGLRYLLHSVQFAIPAQAFL